MLAVAAAHHAGPLRRADPFAPCGLYLCGRLTHRRSLSATRDRVIGCLRAPCRLPPMRSLPMAITSIGILKPPLGRGKGKNGDPLGTFNPDEPVVGFENEQILKRVAGPQIAELYGTRFRSTPMYFISDDHDYFENDDAIDRWITFPPENLELQLQRATQHLYYPEFLHDAERPLGLSGSAAADRSAGLSECFGTLRYGKLLEVLMYDCGRYVSLKDKFAGLIPPDAERWLIKRTQTDDTQHLIHIPSTPFGWSAGKWREWYPDLLEQPAADSPAGTKAFLSTKNPKYMWQTGWYPAASALVRCNVVAEASRCRDVW